MKSVLVLATVLAVTRLVDCSLCEFDSCTEVKCPEVTKESCDGNFVKNGSVCLGCCDVCYSIIEPGEVCMELDWFDSYENFVYAECSDGYYCDFLGTQKCLKSEY